MNTYTTETRLDFRNNQNQEVLKYLLNYITFYNKIKRYVYLYCISHDNIDTIKFIQQTALKYNVLQRNINSIYNEVQGEIAAYKELKKLEQASLKRKIESYKKKLTPKKKEIKELKKRFVEHTITINELKELKILKNNLFLMNQKLNRLKQKLNKLNQDIDNKKISMCYGTKAYFRKQYNLEFNNLSFMKWRNNFIKKRDANIFLQGGKHYKQGNDIAQLFYNTDTDDFTLKLCIDKPYRTNNHNDKDKFFVINHLNFKNLHSELKYICINNQNKTDKQALTIRIHRENNKWYLQVMFKLKPVPIQTTTTDGVIGLDYNENFIQVAELDSKGNLINLSRIELPYKTNSNKAKTYLRQQIYDLIKEAESKGKTIVAENLNFTKSKAKMITAKSKKGKIYNKMISNLAYSDYKQVLNNISYKNGVMVKFVPPYNTSKVGKTKYNYIKKLTTHQSAAYVIGRSGMGFKDKAIINNKLVKVY